MIPIVGGCLCKKVRYRIALRPISQGVCYCQQCQKLGGSYGNPMMLLQKNSFECTLEVLSFYTTTSDRGSTVNRHFCNACGCYIFAEISDIP